MNSQTTYRYACLLFLTGLLALVISAPAYGVGYSFGRHPDKERLVFAFDGKTPPRFSVKRTDRQELTVSIPANTFGSAGVAPDFGGSQLVSGIGRRGNSIVVSLKTDAFGYVSFGLDGTGKVVVDVFSDPLGARWKGTPKPKSEPVRPVPPAPKVEPVKAESPAKPVAPKPDPKAEAVVDTGPVLDLPPVVPEKQKQQAEPVPEAVTPDEPAMPVMRQRTPVAKQPDATPSKRNSFRMKISPPDGQSKKQDAPVVADAAPAVQDDPAPVMRRKDSEPSPPAAKQRSGASSGRMKIASSDEPESKAESAPKARMRIASQPEAAPKMKVADAEEAPRMKAAKPSTPSAPLTREDVERERGVSVKAPKSGRMKISPPGGAPAPVAQRKPSGRMKVTPPGAEPEQGDSASPSGRMKIAQPGAVPESVPEKVQEPAMTEEVIEEPLVAEEPLAAPVEEAQPEEPPRKLDENGDPIPTHEEKLEEIMFAARTAHGGGQYDATIEQLDLLLRQKKVPEDMREEAMYMKADTLNTMYKDELEDHFDEINGAYESAINFNLDSYRVPAALLRRGQINLKVGNVPEAAAFFRILRKNFKGDPNVPLTYYYWGDHYFKNKEFQKAADEFQYLVQVYPDSKFVREASLGLARALRELGYDKQAFQVVDFIEKRWPRFYVEFPPFLRLLGDAAYSVENYEKAKNNYWTYYNIDPQGDEADIILAKLGDSYVNTNRKPAARELYQKAAADFPEREGGLVAKMRLAEEGVYDAPSVEDMYSVFDRPYNLKPAEIYNEIVNEHKDSPLAPLAQLKLAMWDLWNGKYLDSMDAVSEFEEKFPGSELRGKARDVGNRAFAEVVDKLVADKNYPKIVELYKEHPFVRENSENLSPSAKLALGLSFWKQGAPAKALKTIMPFMNEEQVPETSEMAMSLALSIFVDNQSWEKVLDVAEAVRDWEIQPDYRRELDYARALAHENLGEFKQSRPLWATLGTDRQLDSLQRAYAQFFLAQEALEIEELRRAYDFAQDAYEVFTQDGTDQPKIKECLRMLADATERSGRFREAVKWATELEKMIGRSDPAWPGLRYRLAGLHKKGGDPAKWRVILDDLAKTLPGTLYGRMATSDLQIENIERAAQEYQPTSQF